MAFIKVYIRVRPLNASEQAVQVKNIVEIPSNTEIVINLPTENYTNRFLYDGVFGSDCGQYDIFRAIFTEVNQEVLKGFNNAVFACGQTISGKSYTMFGDECNLAQLEKMSSIIADNSLIGVIPRTIHDLFVQLHRLRSEFSIRISYLKIYNEELNDLLSSNASTALKIYEDSNGKVRVNGLSEIVVASPKAAYIELLKGQERLKEHNLARGRSKSHTIFTISVYIKEKAKTDDDDEVLKFSKLSLVELAANENAAAAKTAGRKINHSLLSFSRVIQALIDKSNHIPYRDSKLTRILQESLGGNSKTSIIATVAPGSNNFEETVSTLEYVQRAKHVCNKPRINERLNKTIMLNEISEEIHRLRCDIQANKTKTGRFLTDEVYSDYQNQLNTSRTNLKIRKTEIDVLNEKYSNVEGLFDGVHSDLQKHNEKIRNLKENIAGMELEKSRTVQQNMERDYLIRKHGETEEELKKQATELQTVVEKSCDDIEKVHDSIERRKLVDQQIEWACDKFSREMKMQFEQMRHSTDTNATNLKQLLSKYAVFCDEHHKQTLTILENFKSNTEHLKENNFNVAEINQSILEKTVQVANLHSAFKENSHMLLTNCMDTRTRSDKTQISFETFLEIVEKQDELSAHALNTIKSMISHQSQIVKTFCENIKETARLFYTDLLDSLKRSRLTVDETNRSSVKISSEMQTIFGEMSELLNQANANNSVLLNEVGPSLISLGTKVKQSTDTQLNGISMQLSKLHDLENYERAFGTAALSEYKVNVKKISEAVETERETKIQMVSGRCNVVEGNANTVEAFDNVNRQFDGFVKEVREIPLKLMNNPLNEQITTDLQTASDCIKGQGTHSVKESCSLKDLQRNFDETTEEAIDYCRERLHQLHENEFKIYLSNGDTPVKREYKINRVLAATSPHERIKQRFHENFQNNYDSDLDLSVQGE